MLTLILLVSVAFAAIPRHEVAKNVMKNAEASTSDGEDLFECGDKDPNVANKKYLYWELSEYINVEILDGCEKVEENKWMKKMPYNDKCSVEKYFGNDKCTGNPTSEEKYHYDGYVLKYADELPNHIGYEREFDINDQKCQNPDETSLKLFNGKCIEEQGLYHKYQVEKDHMIKRWYTDSECKNVKTDNPEKNKYFKCNECSYGSDNYVHIGCVKYGEKPYGEKDDSVANMKYLADEWYQIIDLFTLNECFYWEKGRWRKYVPFNGKYYIRYIYNTTECSGDSIDEDYSYIDPEDTRYTNDIPEHIAYQQHYRDEKCGTADPYVTLYTGECKERSTGNVYTKYSIEGDKLVGKIYTDKDCKNEKKEITEADKDYIEEEQCDQCAADSERMKVFCSEYSGTTTMFMMLVVAILFFVF